MLWLYICQSCYFPAKFGHSHSLAMTEQSYCKIHSTAEVHQALSALPFPAASISNNTGILLPTSLACSLCGQLKCLVQCPGLWSADQTHHDLQKPGDVVVWLPCTEHALWRAVMVTAAGHALLHWPARAEKTLSSSWTACVTKFIPNRSIYSHNGSAGTASLTSGDWERKRGNME